MHLRPRDLSETREMAISRLSISIVIAVVYIGAGSTKGTVSDRRVRAFVTVPLGQLFAVGRDSITGLWRSPMSRIIMAQHQHHNYGSRSQIFADPGPAWQPASGIHPRQIINAAMREDVDSLIPGDIYNFRQKKHFEFLDSPSRLC